MDIRIIVCNTPYNKFSFVHDYNYQMTLSMYEFPIIDIQHIFANEIIRDLDNQNREYLIDVIRHIRIIKDDNFKHLLIFEEGIFVLENKNFKDFMEYKNEFALRDNADFEGIIK